MHERARTTSTRASGTDDVSQKIHQLIFDNLMVLDDHLRVVPGWPSGSSIRIRLTYVATLRRGVRFHDGHELTSADVVYTFRCLLDPAFVLAAKGGYRELASVDARDRYTVVFTLKEPFASFPINLVCRSCRTAPAPIVPRAPDRHRPVPLRPLRRRRPPRARGRSPTTSAARRRTTASILKIVPDDIMRGLELRKGTMDIVVNDLAPDIVHQLQQRRRGCRRSQAPGVDYQYIGAQPARSVLRTCASGRRSPTRSTGSAIVELPAPRPRHAGRSGCCRRSRGRMRRTFSFPHDPARAKALLDEAGYPDPDGDGPGSRGFA